MQGLQLDLSGVISEAIDSKFKEFDIENQVKNMLGEVTKNASKVIEVRMNGEDKGRKFSMYHKQFETLLKCVTQPKLNILLTGGAGRAKSTAVQQVAEALGLGFGSISFSNQSTKTDLLGFVDANGIYRKSSFIDAFEHGKVFLADEMDACSANVLVLLNSAISNGFIETPDNKMIYANETFRFVGTANTNLRGAKNGFTARNKLDAATIDRFVVIEWELDEELESRIANNDGWVALVRKCREVANAQLEGVDITPRSSFDGAKLLQAGFDVDSVIRMTIIKAMGEDEEKTLLGAITKKMKDKAVSDAGQEVKKPEPIVVDDETPNPEVDEVVLKDDGFDKVIEEVVEGIVNEEKKKEDEDDFDW